jgi:hypothetical protein
MHWRTFERLVAEYVSASRVACGAMHPTLERWESEARAGRQAFDATVAGNWMNIEWFQAPYPELFEGNENNYQHLAETLECGALAVHRARPSLMRSHAVIGCRSMERSANGRLERSRRAGLRAAWLSAGGRIPSRVIERSPSERLVAPELADEPRRLPEIPAHGPQMATI